MGSVSRSVTFWYHDISKFDRIIDVYDHCSNLKFIFKCNRDEERIKGCGAFQVYATTSEFKMFRSSSKDIFKSESIRQLAAPKRITLPER
ncbi:hypothetical protein CR513_17459, partial [Mucuna pruriens]